MSSHFQFSIFNFQLRKRPAFTLIELLVSVSIIAVLTSIGLAVFTSSQKKARDARRQADLEAVRSALELYRSDNPTIGYPADASWVEIHTSSQIKTALSPAYISAMPVDPRDTGTNPACTNGNYGYFYRKSGVSYHLVAGMEAQATTNCPNWCGGGSAPISCYFVTSP